MLLPLRDGDPELGAVLQHTDLDRDHPVPVDFDAAHHDLEMAPLWGLVSHDDVSEEQT